MIWFLLLPAIVLILAIELIIEEGADWDAGDWLLGVLFYILATGLSCSVALGIASVIGYYTMEPTKTTVRQDISSVAIPGNNHQKSFLVANSKNGDLGYIYYVRHRDGSISDHWANSHYLRLYEERHLAHPYVVIHKEKDHWANWGTRGGGISRYEIHVPSNTVIRTTNSALGYTEPSKGS